VLGLIENVSQTEETTKVFTFGISSGCDQDLVKRAAKAGNGSCEILMDSDMKFLKEKVVKSLRRAGAPAL